MDVAIGFRTHSGWAAVVAVGLSDKGPIVCDRRMIVLADAEIPGSKQLYHAAEPMPTVEAKRYLRRCIDATYQLAIASLETILHALRHGGNEVIAGAMLAGYGTLPQSVEKILASHPAIHMAEGELYRTAIVRACEACKLPVVRIKEKEVFTLAERAVGLRRKQIEHRIGILGKALGPPWTQDQKLAAVAAWVTLASAKRRRKAAAV